MADDVNSLIAQLFQLGLSNAEICLSLLYQYNLHISERTLKRRLHNLKLYRRKHFSDDLLVAMFIEDQLQAAGKMHGYRWMHLKCRQNGLTVTQDTVRQLMGSLDSFGVQCRRNRRLQRRTYYAEGPNMTWHMDGYDKLKRFGICIHGCIDGFSRHIVWLRASATNNDPRVIARYFMDAVVENDGCPRILRADMGTENTVVEQLQLFLRQDQQSFMYGRSVRNQRIESWWGILRRQNMQYWINLFEKLSDDMLFDGSDLDKSIVQFCFLHLIQVIFKYCVYSVFHVVVHLWLNIFL
jgi:hypothetical protein